RRTWHLGPLELPGGIASRVNEEAIHARCARVIELDLEPVVVVGDEVTAHAAFFSVASPSTPCAIWPSRREAALSERMSGLLVKDWFIGHGVVPSPGRLLDLTAR